MPARSECESYPHIVTDAQPYASPIRQLAQPGLGRLDKRLVGNVETAQPVHPRPMRNTPLSTSERILLGQQLHRLERCALRIPGPWAMSW